MPARAPGNLVKPTLAGATAAGEELEARMQELRMNQRELAQASGINAMTISRLVRAQVDKTYRPDKLGTLSVALGWRKDRLASILTEQPARQDDDRLARIEAKLDELLERFDALGKAFYPKG